MENAFWYVQTNGIESLAEYRDVSARVRYSVIQSSAMCCAVSLFVCLKI